MIFEKRYIWQGTYEEGGLISQATRREDDASPTSKGM